MKQLLKDKTIAIVGYGSQGHAHALNLKDSGYHVVVALRAGSPNYKKAKKQGFIVMSVSEATKKSDLIMMLIPDMAQPTVYAKEIASHLSPGKTLAFAHGFNIHFKTIIPPKDVDVILIAPKGPGQLVRELYQQNSGVPALYAVEQNPSKKAEKFAQEYAYAIGCPKGALIKTTFTEETETDLFGEQAVLCGGLTRLIVNGFETLVNAGYQPQVAYFECLHELKLIADLIYQYGIDGMRKRVSETAQWGDYSTGDKIFTKSSRKAMEKTLEHIRSGKFAREWIQEHQSGMKHFHSARKRGEEHSIEKVGKLLRAMMKKSKVI